MLLHQYSLYKVLILSVVFTLMIDQCDNSILLYNTEDDGYRESSHCMFYQKKYDVKYCIRWNTEMPLSRNRTSCLHGQKWHFTALLEEKISPWDILSWNSGVEKVDTYARIFYNHSQTFEEENPFLCNCAEGYFGEQCEYTLLFDSSSFSKALQTLFQGHIDSFGHQNRGKILCYETLTCDSGILCLNWRDICDGRQNCINGTDEKNCDLLEFNECEENEYRCLDGMCIAEEFWLDGKSDYENSLEFK